MNTYLFKDSLFLWDVWQIIQLIKSSYESIKKINKNELP